MSFSDAAARSPRSLLTSSAGWLRTLPVSLSILWGAEVVAIRYVLSDVAPLRAAAIKAGLAALALMGWAWVHRGSPLVRARHRAATACVSALTALYFLFLYVALDLTSVVHVAVLLYVYPLFTAWLGHYLLSRERLTARIAIGLAIGFVGATLTVGDRGHSPVPSTYIGDAFALAAALVWAVTTTYTKRALPNVDPLCLALYPVLLSFLLLGAASLALESTPERMTWLAIVALLYQGIVVGAFTRLVSLYLLPRMKMATYASYTFFTPVSGLILSALLLGEPISWPILASLALIVSGLAAVTSPGAPAIAPAQPRVAVDSSAAGPPTPPVRRSAPPTTASP